MPNKVLGQNFLKNKGKIKKIVESLGIEDNELVVEIGPGKGAITKFLMKETSNLFCVEKDRNLVKEITESLDIEEIGNIKEGDYKNKVIRGDILEILPRLSKEIMPYPYKLVGNIPYYITGKLLRTIEEIDHKPISSVFGIQKQVAERLTSEPPNMNILAASVQFWAETEIIEDIPKKDFYPSPKVDGAIIRLKTKEKLEEKENYYKIIKIIFKHPRKTLANNLSSAGIDKEEAKDILESKGILPFWRPENLSIQDIKEISKLIKKDEVG